MLAIVLKEWKEYLAGPGLRGGRASLFVMLMLFGVILPLQRGIDWLTSPLLIVAWVWVPLMLIASVVADSFAGERERHTLETLLASRLPDAMILLGKVAGAVGYAWGVTLIMAAVSVLSVNALHWQGHALLLPSRSAVAGPVLSFLTTTAAASAGALVSLRASGAREAAQTLSIVAMLLIFVPIYGLQALAPELRAAIAARFAHNQTNVGLAELAGLLAIVDALLLLLALARFQRGRLILE